jgi:hypothetical protein
MATSLGPSRNRRFERRLRTIDILVVTNSLVINLDSSNEVSLVNSLYDPQVEFLEVAVQIDGAVAVKAQLLACLKAGTVSTNVQLRKLHNFCLSMNWLPWPLIPKRLWPEVRFPPKRAITFQEHQLIIEREKNPERRNFYRF